VASRSCQERIQHSFLSFGIHDSVIHVRQSVWNGRVTTPKNENGSRQIDIHFASAINDKGEPIYGGARPGIFGKPPL
jgi:hypothetical protein